MTVAARVVRGLLSRRPSTLVRLSRRPPVTVGGETLDPQLQLLLALRGLTPSKPMPSLPPASARKQLDREAKLFAGVPAAVGTVTDRHDVAGAEGPLRARHYSPPPLGTGAPLEAREPLLVFLHGGGYVVGSIESHDEACRLICHHAQVHVLSVDYRLAPEHPFPAGLLDARAALTWAIEHAEELGADPERVAIGGDSAGGNLAAGAVLLARDDGGLQAAAQVLIYPSTDFVGGFPSGSAFDHGLFLERDEMDWFEANYRGSSGVAEDDPRLSPLRAPDLSGLPPAIVATAAMDPLRDEGEAYAARLAEAGTRVVAHRAPGLIHGYINMTGVSSACRDETVALAGMVRGLLGSRPERARAGTSAAGHDATIDGL